MLSGCTRKLAVSSTQGTSPPTPGISGGSSNADVAQYVTATALAQVKLPRGATVIAGPAVPSATYSATQLASDNLVELARWYSVRESQTGVLRYIEERVPPGFRDGGRQGSEVYFEAAATSQYENPQIVVDAEQSAGRVLVKVDVSVAWRPARSSADAVPDDITAATLVEGRAKVTLAPDQARALGRVLKGLWAEEPRILACAMPATIVASFAWPGGRLDFVPNCEGIGVLANGVLQTELENSNDLLPVRDAYFAFAATPPSAPTSPSPNPSSIPAAASPSTASPSPTGPRLVLTNADDGRAITVVVGTFIDVELAVDSPTTVDPAVADRDVLEPLGFSTGSSSRSEASFRAVANGNAKLFAMTHPVCATFPVCGAARVFEFDVRVIPSR
jgi:hypothetical protein